MNGLQNHAAPDDADSYIWGGVEMGDYPKSDYTPAEVRKAGKALSLIDLPYTEDVVRFFRVAHNWRMAHAFPMTQELKQLSRTAGASGLTVGRIKRMASIRRKLTRIGLHLDKVQDLAGVRAILPDMSEVRRVTAAYCEGRHSQSIGKVNDYIEAPKETGYRSVHIVKTYTGSFDAYAGLKVEIQIRTRLQHIWATAQETIGIMTDLDLKGGEGTDDWRRVMVLMASYLAGVEGEPFPSIDPANRPAEMRDIDARLGVVQLLAGARLAIENSEFQRQTGGFFILSMDDVRRTVTVTPVGSFKAGAERYFRSAEAGEGMQTLMVAADSAAALRRAYPSYFMDIGEFLSHMRDAIAGKRPAYSTRPAIPQTHAHEPASDYLLEWNNWRAEKQKARTL